MFNTTYYRVMQEALAQGVTKSTVEKAVKNSKTEKCEEALFEVRSIGRTGIIVEMMGKSKDACRVQLQGYIFLL